tara:strand:- start:27 stop:650 length:624 start_codon:yes stop_codon:yes gene_type:complete
MAKRILPYRDYSEHDVVNLFALDVSSATLADMVPGSSGDFDAGVVVKVSAGALPGDTPSTLETSGSLRDYLGASFSGAHIGFNAYPSNGMTVVPADGSGATLGITLRETLAFDENGEKMLYYKQKLDEAQGVLPGETVPVLCKGMVLLAASAFTSAPSLGDDLEVDSSSGNAGKLVTASTGTVVGKVIATGVDTSNSAAKFLCKVSF